MSLDCIRTELEDVTAVFQHALKLPVQLYITLVSQLIIELEEIVNIQLSVAHSDCPVCKNVSEFVCD